MPPKTSAMKTFFLIDLNSKDLQKIKKYVCKIMVYNYFIKMNQTKNTDMYKIGLIGNSESQNYKSVEISSEWTFYSLDDFNKLFEGWQPRKSGNLYEAIELAVWHLENDNHVDKCDMKNIVLMSDLTSELITDNNLTELSRIKNKIADLNIWFYTLGPQVKVPYLGSWEDIENWADNVEPAPNVTLNEVEKLNLKFVKSVLVKGFISDLENGFHLFFYYKPEMKAPFPWYIEMSLGDISFPINVIKLVQDPPRVKLTEESINGDEMSTKEWISKETNETVPDDKVIKGYNVHGQIIVFSSEKEQDESYKIESNVEKSFSILLFFENNEMLPLYFFDDSISIVVPDDRNDEYAADRYNVLLEAMRQRNLVALATRVYADGPQFTPQPYILFPCPEKKHDHFLTVRFPFEDEFVEDDIRQKEKKCEPVLDDPELKAAVYGFLDAMTADRNNFSDDGKLIHPLSEHMKCSPNLVSQYEYLTSSIQGANKLSDDEETAPDRIIDDYQVHPILKERSKPYTEVISEILKKYEIEDEDDLDIYKTDDMIKNKDKGDEHDDSKPDECRAS